MELRHSMYGEFAVHLACDVYDGVFLCCSFSPRGVLDEILNLIESVSEVFSSYFITPINRHGVCKLVGR